VKITKKIVLCIIGLLLSCNLALAWDLTGMLQEWDTSPLRPYDIVVLSDGSPWLNFYDESADEDIGRMFTINPSGGSTAAFEAPFPARFITIDRALDDSIWIADRLDKIVRFEPESRVFTAYDLPGDTFDLPAMPRGVSVSTEGTVWFTYWGSPGESAPGIGMFDPETETWQSFPLHTDCAFPPDSPVEIAFGPDGTVWFTVVRVTDANPGLVNLNPATGEFRCWTDPALFPDIPWWDPFGISIVDGTVWFITHHANHMARFDTVSETFTFFEIPATELNDTHYFIVDPEGIFWLTGFASSSVGTFDPETGIFDSLPLADPLAHPMGIALSPRGEVWWAEGFTSGEGGVGRFIPHVEYESGTCIGSICYVPCDPAGAGCPQSHCDIYFCGRTFTMNVGQITYNSGMCIGSPPPSSCIVFLPVLF
jgi:streptogramin lyase